MTNKHTIGELIKLSAGYLEEKGCSSARLDAELLLAHVLELDRLDLYLNFDKPLDNREVSEYRSLIGRRGQRIPVAYLTGVKEFYSLPFKVTPAVLIPRPETEFIIDKILELVEPDEPVKILEIGTGSGAIAIALACQDPNFSITATDISREALDIAKNNAANLEVCHQISFVEADLFTNVEGKFEIICSNPPYIPSDELSGLAPELFEEPSLALDGGSDGLCFYNKILEQASSYLENPGFVVLEIGWNQAETVRKLGVQAGFQWLETVVDYGGNDRVVIFKWS
ncbi:MAG: peptide chain release factor N(5)-glutamine methyltransferase [Bacillota bacterium]|nr:peptide chain release factor N(5)-glutamine methyltransferase [Bacillota bacterium]